MARELPIHNGRMTTDLDANGFKIKNLPPGSGFTQAQADWSQTDATAPDFIKNKPPIPAAVTVDSTLTEQGAAADAKAVGDALRSRFTEWVFSDVPQGFSVKNVWYETQTPHGARWVVSYNESAGITMSDQTSRDATELTFEEYGVLDVGMTATRHLITPTKTSQLTNDGDGTNAFVKTNDTRLSDARTPTAHHATHAANGSDPIAPADIGAAAASDLPYALVTPGEWEFSEPQGLTNFTVTLIEYDNGHWTLYYTSDETTSDTAGATGSETDLTVTFRVGIDQEYTVTATRASLPGHLCDRAVNAVSVTGATTLTLPALDHAGKARDFLVRLEISGSTVPTITFAAPTGETITYETDGDEFPVPDEAGTWLYAFTETYASTFAVALKKVNTVAQGGS